MDKLILSINDDIMDSLKKIRASETPTVYIDIPEKSVLFENSLNLKLIRKEATKYGKDTVFETVDPVGKNLIEALDSVNPNKVDHEFGFVSQSRNFPQSQVPSNNQTPQKETVTGLLHDSPPVTEPTTNTQVTDKGHVHSDFISKEKKGMSLFSKIFIGVGVALLLLVGFGAYYLFMVLPSAKVKLSVSSQPLVRSVTVQLSTKAAQISSKDRVLPGRSAEASVEISKEVDATGEAIIGDKAKGEVTIINKTSGEAKFKKGTVISIVSSKETLKYMTDEGFTVPAKTEVPNADPTLEPTPVYGRVKVDVTAEAFGTKYNIDDDKNFKISGKDTDDFIATNDKKFSGGSSKTVKAVSQADLDALSKDALAESKDQIADALRAKINSTEKLVDSSIVYKKGTDVFDKKVGDQADKVSVKQTITGTGLYYKSSDLKSLLDLLLKEFVPEGFEISEKDQNIEVGVLTAVDQTAPAESIDLQVKIKAYILPIVDEKSIVAKLKGAKIVDGRTYLSNIKNINSYEIDLWPKLTTYVGRFPNSEDRIEVSIERK